MPRKSSARLAPAQEGPASASSSLVTDEMLRAAETRIGEMELGQRSPFWLIVVEVMTARLERLRTAREYQMTRLARPATTDEHGHRHEPPTLAELAAMQKEIEMIGWLLKTPKHIQDGARADLDRMNQVRRAQA